jgi:hypothetical protein
MPFQEVSTSHQVQGNRSEQPANAGAIEAVARAIKITAHGG